MRLDETGCAWRSLLQMVPSGWNLKTQTSQPMGRRGWRAGQGEMVSMPRGGGG